MKRNYLIKSMVLGVVIVIASLGAAPAFEAQMGKKTEDHSSHFSISKEYESCIVDLISQVNESLIYNYLEGLVEIGPRVTGTKNCKRAAEYLYHEFQKMGLDVYLDDWRHLCFKSQNVIATYKGVDPSSDNVFVLLAHYDSTKYSPGANDDGSGIAAMLAIANICSRYSFNHTIKFIAVSAEEIGFYGSQNYAPKAYKEGENIVAVLNIDTIGSAFTEKGGRSVKLFVPERDRWISSYTLKVSEQYNEYIDLDVQLIPNHPIDHDAFNRYGYDGVFFSQYDPYLYIHSPEDNIDNINFTYYVKVTKLLLALTASLAQKPFELQVQIENPYEGCLYIFNHPLIKLPRPRFSYLQYGLTYILGRCIVRVNVSTNEEIENVYFCIDGDFIIYSRYPSTELEWKIQGYVTPLTGRHTLGVYVYTVDGKVGYDEMDIFIVTFSRLHYLFIDILRLLL